ncbi:hypothetical protein OPT61_g911 [Boeremia exigua]|uniref:Uncharacterized protein n=1 Tax=Boeremia exigua TaxID=749465 RepID=A0ACC2IS90_9PLEO|nr:hypothetical protein OPT61_g911 [Boeremia exigua]
MTTSSGDRPFTVQEAGIHLQELTGPSRLGENLSRNVELGIANDDVPPPASISETNRYEGELRGDARIQIEDHYDASSVRPESIDAPSASVTDGVDVPPTRRPNTFRRGLNRLRPYPEPVTVTEVKTRTLENTPNGFPRLAAFQVIEPNHSIYRGFAYLHSRVLLELQDELTELELELDECDWDEYDEDPDRPRFASHVLQNDAVGGLGQVLANARSIQTFQKPIDSTYLKVRRYHNKAKPLADYAMESIRCKGDQITLRSGRELASFDAWIEHRVDSILGHCDGLLQRIFKARSPPLYRWLATPELRTMLSNTDVIMYSSSHMDKVVSVLVSIMIFCLLIVPLVAIYRLNHPQTPTSTVKSIGILAVFAIIFTGTLSVVTRTSRHELFVASAGYCAILLVFISGSGEQVS